MDGPEAKRWWEAIFARASRRRYDGREVDAEVLERLGNLCRAFRPFGRARAVLLPNPPAGLFLGILGSYGSIRGAPHALAVVGPSSVEAGYTGEAVVLEATALGLGTCWVGGMFDRMVVSALLDLADDEDVFAVSPLGWACERKGIGERLMSGIARSAHRKTLGEIAPGSEDWPLWARRGVEAARLAPSAVNRQPWRFRREGGTVVLEVDGPRDSYKIPKRLDCGIAMLHFELGARESGVPGTWSVLAPPRVGAYHPH